MTHQRNQMISQTKEHRHFTACIPDLRQHTVLCLCLAPSAHFSVYSICLRRGGSDLRKPGKQWATAKNKPRCLTQPPLLLSFPPCCPRPSPRTAGLEDAPPWINKTELHYVDDFWGNVQVWLMWKPICMLHPKATQRIWMTTLIYGNCNCFISLCKSIGSGIRVIIDN